MTRSTPLLAYNPPAMSNPIFVDAVDAGFMQGTTNPNTAGTTVRSDSFIFSSAQDYIIRMPGALPRLGVGYNTLQSTPLRKKGGLQFKGGHNIQVIGGEVDISTDWVADAGLLYGHQGSYSYEGSKRNRALYLLDWSGVAHIEGLHLHGQYLYEAVNVLTSSTGIVQFQNIKVTAHGTGTDRAGVRYAPAGTSSADQIAGGIGGHDGGDIFQTQAPPPRQILMDGYYFETSWFQGIFLKTEPTYTHPTLMQVDNVYGQDYQGPGGFFYINKDSSNAYPPDVRVGDNVSMEPGLQRYPISQNVTGQRSYTTKVEGMVFPRVLDDATNGVIRATDGTSDYVYWPTDLVKKLDGTPGAKIRERTLSGGESAVLSGSPGMSYVSPGYIPLPVVLPDGFKRSRRTGSSGAIHTG